MVLFFFLAEKDSLLKIGCSRGLECDFFMCLKFVQGAKMVGHISLQQKLIILEEEFKCKDESKRKKFRF